MCPKKKKNFFLFRVKGWKSCGKRVTEAEYERSVRVDIRGSRVSPKIKIQSETMDFNSVRPGWIMVDLVGLGWIMVDSAGFWLD